MGIVERLFGRGKGKDAGTDGYASKQSLSQSYRQLSNSELADIVNAPREFTEEAVETASEELSRRGEKPQKPSAAATRAERPKTDDIMHDLNFIFRHPSPVVFGVVASDVQQALGRVERAGDAAVPLIETAITDRAAGRSGGSSWWLGAQELSRVLARIGTAGAMKALLDIVRTDSHIHEYKWVREVATNQLAVFRDPQLVPELVRCMELADAPILAIKKALEEMGQQVPSSPDLVIEEGRSIEDPSKAIAHFSRHETEAAAWPKERQCGFYYFAARKVERVHGLEASLPLYAAAVSADPDPSSAAWLHFDEPERSPSAAKRLAEKYPLKVGYLSNLAKVRDETA